MFNDSLNTAQEELEAMYAKPMKSQNRISTTNMEDNVMYQSGPNLPNREPENHAINPGPEHTDMEDSPANFEPNGDGGMNPYVLMWRLWNKTKSIGKDFKVLISQLI